MEVSKFSMHVCFVFSGVFSLFLQNVMFGRHMHEFAFKNLVANYGVAFANKK